MLLEHNRTAHCKLQSSVRTHVTCCRAQMHLPVVSQANSATVVVIYPPEPLLACPI